MLTWIFGKLKNLFLLAAVGGPALAGFMWWDAQHIKDVATHGVEATATIEGATRTKRRRGGTSHEINLAWTDASGAARQATGVGISSALVPLIIRNDKIVRDKIRIKYLVDDADAKPILIEDVGRQAEADQELIWIGSGAGVVGIIGSLFFWIGGRRRSTEEA